MSPTKQIKQIMTHVDVMSTERMRKHAMTGPEGDHDLPFQIFRYLSGYDEALGRIEELENAIQKAISIDVRDSYSAHPDMIRELLNAHPVSNFRGEDR